MSSNSRGEMALDNAKLWSQTAQVAKGIGRADLELSKSGQQRVEERPTAERLGVPNPRARTLVIQLVTTPGSGTAGLLEALREVFGPAQRMAVVSSDQMTDLTAAQVEQGFAEQFAFLFVEDSCLDCPAPPDSGRHLRLIVRDGADSGLSREALSTADGLVITVSDFPTLRGGSLQA